MRLTKKFYQNKPSEKLARELLGKVFCHKINQKTLKGIISEVEVYDQWDEASHSYSGITKHNQVMFLEAGFLYVYFVYGKHYCLNVVSGKKGEGAAILIRNMICFEESLETIIINRKYSKKTLSSLLNGPGKICQAFQISLQENGVDLKKSPNIYLADYRYIPKKINLKPRIGISKAKEKLLNFSFEDYQIKKTVS